MSEKRRDNKGRILRDNERQRSDGSYEYRYVGTDGKKKSVYSWKLVSTDRTPEGKKDKPCLRDQEKSILRDMQDGMYIDGGKRTVIEQCERYLLTKTGVAPTTEANYKTTLNVLRREAFGTRQIETVKIIMNP